MKYKLILTIILFVGIVLVSSFGKKQNRYEVKEFESQYYVTLWLNENQPSEVVNIATTGTLWWVFYVR